LTCITYRTDRNMDDRPEPRTLAIEVPRTSLRTAGWTKPSVEKKLDQALEQTFPASDAFEVST
jgi:hypothetical protein